MTTLMLEDIGHYYIPQQFELDYYSCENCGDLFNETNLGAFPEFSLWCQNCRPGLDMVAWRKEMFEKRTLSGENDGRS